MKELMPGFEELHIAKVSDGSYILRSDKGVVVTATNFGQVKKQAASFFDEVRSDAVKVTEEDR